MAYSTIQDHQYMLFDDLRNSFYFDAIQKSVKQNSIVMDLGAGLGLHGFMAKSCGAKKVYLLEPAQILDITKMVAKENNFTDKIACISNKVENIELSEQVDIIISVFTGNFLLTEDLLPSLFHARDKYLRPGGKMIPDRAKMIVAPVMAEDYYETHIECWSKKVYNVDYSVARKYAVNSLYYDNPAKRKINLLSEPTNLLELDFMIATDASCKNKIEISIIEDGIIHGFLGWFDTKIGEKWLSTSPEEEQTHWRQVFLPLSNPIIVKNGDTISFEVNRPEFGEWSWIVGYDGKYQKHSTFLSQPLKVEDMLKKIEDYKGNLKQKGKITQEVLEQLDGTNSTIDISLNIFNNHPNTFNTKDEAYQFVQRILEKYC